VSFAQMMEGPIISFVEAYDDFGYKREYRQEGWLIAGGPYDGEFVPWPEDPLLKYRNNSMGSYSPVYIEVTERLNLIAPK
jgi:hypothetical protein